MPNGEDAGVGTGCAACTCIPGWVGGLEEASRCAGNRDAGGFGGDAGRGGADGGCCGGASFGVGGAAGFAAGAGFDGAACARAGSVCAAGFSGVARAGCGVNLACGCCGTVAGLAALRLAGPLAASELTSSTGISTVAAWPAGGVRCSWVRRNSAKRCSARLTASAAANGDRLCAARMTAAGPKIWLCSAPRRSASNAGGLESWIKRRNSRVRKQKP